jgi:hypothetical protein
MMRLRTYLLAAAAALFCALPARAQSYCDNQTSGLMLPMPNYNMTFAQWSTCSRNSLLKVNASSASLTGSTTTASLFGDIYVNRIGGRSVGTPNIRVSSPVYTTDTTPYLLWKGSASFEGPGFAVAGASGAVITYGVVAGTGVFVGLTASSANLQSIVSSTTIKGAGGLGVDYGVRSGSLTVINGLTASSGTFTATGASQYSLQTSSGLSMGAGTLKLDAGSRGVDASGTGIVASTGNFTATGNTQYSLTLSSGIDASAGCIKLKNGTLCGASVAGDVTAAGNNAFTGANTHAGSETMIAGSTLAFTTVQSVSGATTTILNSGACSGCFAVVATTYPAEGSKVFAFTGLKSSTTYRMSVNLRLQTTDGHPFLQFNGDAGTNYAWGYDAFSTGEGGVVPNGATGVDRCYLMASGSAAWDAGTQGMWEFIFNTDPRDSKIVTVMYQGTTNKNGLNVVSWKGVCKYVGAANVATITYMVTGGGSFVGEAVLEAKGR